MGRSSFAVRFTAQVGRTPMDVVTDSRMRCSAELLQQGELKIIEISARAGYRSEAAFSRRFRRHFGVSPRGMRRNAQMHDKVEPCCLASGKPTHNRSSAIFRVINLYVSLAFNQTIARVALVLVQWEKRR